MTNYIRNLLKMKYPFRYLTSRLLVKTGVCRLFIIKTNAYKLHYYPTTISSELWIDPFQRKYKMLPYIKKGGIIVDVGANIGTTVIPSAMIVGDSGRVIAFEAHPRTFKYLTNNIKLNGLNNISVYNYAISSVKGELTITDNESDDQNSVNSNSFGNKVQSAPLDAFTADLDYVDLLKIDVEGFELFVLQGAEKTLKKTKCINIEISEAHFNKYGYSCKDLMQKLNDSGFHCYRFDGVDLPQMIDIDFLPESEYENILAKNMEFVPCKN